VTESHPTTVEEIFLAAVELNAESQRVYLDDVCAGKPDLRQEVEAMLMASAGSESFFDSFSERLGIAGLLAAADSVESASRMTPGLRVGPYTLTRRIGAGGMGTVWQADRSDGRFKGSVAIKFLNVSTSGPASKRFELEGRYLARLTHPAIARLLDAGVLHNGQPYLVLEYVEGTPLDQYCDNNGLSVERRLRLFLEVLDGVAHAHSHLIVHRDLKPANILVSPSGAVKLLDFGVAKLIDPEGKEAGNLTHEFGAALTPNFAAPEQLIGGKITTATDVYALGLLLYLLLAGKNPRSLLDFRSGEPLTILLKSEPPTLSDAVTIRADGDSNPAENAACRNSTIPGLQRTLRGDVDNIVRKALSNEVEGRYSSISEFAEDIHRYLRHEPVLAKPNTATYRLKKFTRRHRGGVIGACLTLVALLAATAITTVQLFEARKQRDFALEQQQIAVTVSGFANLLFEEIGESGEAFTVVDLLERGVRALDKRRAAGRPYLTATYYDLAQHFSNLGHKDRVLDLLELSAKLAREQGNGDLEARSLCSKTSMVYRADPDLARDSLAQGLSTMARNRGSSLLATRVGCARAQSFVLELDGESDEARRVLQTALTYFDESPLELNNTKAALIGHLSSLHYKAGELPTSFELNEQVLAILSRDGRDGGLGFAIVSSNQAGILQQMGEVLAAMRRREAIIQRARPMDESGGALSGVWAAYAAGLIQLNRLDEAMDILTRYRERAETRGHRVGVARIDLQVGRALGLRGDFEGAHAALDRVETFYTASARASVAALRGLKLIRTGVLIQELRLDDASAAADELLADIGYPGRIDGLAADKGLWLAARVAYLQGRNADAERLATDAFDAARRIARAPENSSTVGRALLVRAESKIASGQPDDAAADLDVAVTALTNGFGAEHPDTLRAQLLRDQLRSE
jgi:serine/threonine-protein kinase